jgi:plasmid stability protein
MTITVNLGPEAQVELQRQAAAHGRPVEEEAALLLEEVLHPINRGLRDRERALAAAARIREIREHATLSGLTIRELIDEGRP